MPQPTTTESVLASLQARAAFADGVLALVKESGLLKPKRRKMKRRKKRAAKAQTQVKAAKPRASKPALRKAAQAAAESSKPIEPREGRPERRVFAKSDED